MESHARVQTGECRQTLHERGASSVKSALAQGEKQAAALRIKSNFLLYKKNILWHGIC
ncbi:MAG TPA: hypothetical protein PLF25_04260 [Accumulibacter sp.]|nr:hypothetical protein [Accumulibacter sp.]